MEMNIIETEIQGVFIIEPKVFGDSRGYFFESFSDRDFCVHVREVKFVQDNESKSCYGVLRGLHFQKKYSQAKLVRVIKGEVYDVAVDLRKGSPTYGQWEGVYLSAENKRQFYVPEGFAHGFVVLSETATFNYKCTDFYSPEHDGGLLWNDEDVAIEWPLEGIEEVLLSEKDKKQKTLKELDLPFVYK